MAEKQGESSLSATLYPQTRDRFWKRAASILAYTDIHLLPVFLYLGSPRDLQKTTVIALCTRSLWHLDHAFFSRTQPFAGYQAVKGLLHRT